MPVNNASPSIAKVTPESLQVDRPEAKQIVLTDNAGKQRLIMNIDDQNTVRLTINRGNQSARSTRSRSFFYPDSQRWPTTSMTKNAHVIISTEKKQPRMVPGQSVESAAKFFYYDETEKLVELIKRPPSTDDANSKPL
ncbi:MAG: hypothetical protein MKZ94_14225 [Pirellulales bacterium]|nr:hypothetical protein [Pirellulales bacterium]